MKRNRINISALMLTAVLIFFVRESQAEYVYRWLPGARLEIYQSDEAQKEPDAQPGQKESSSQPKEEKDVNKRMKEAMDQVFMVLNTIYQQDELPAVEKKKRAIEFVRKFRYGPENKDYFWIVTLGGQVEVDPYIVDLEGKVLFDFIDPNGIKVFQELIRICLQEGDGYATYLWPKYENKQWHVPKVAYARFFEENEWVIGTGTYPITIQIFDDAQPLDIDDTQPATPL